MHRYNENSVRAPHIARGLPATSSIELPEDGGVAGCGAGISGDAAVASGSGGSGTTGSTGGEANDGGAWAEGSLASESEAAVGTGGVSAATTGRSAGEAWDVVRSDGALRSRKGRNCQAAIATTAAADVSRPTLARIRNHARGFDDAGADDAAMPAAATRDRSKPVGGPSWPGRGGACPGASGIESIMRRMASTVAASTSSSGSPASSTWVEAVRASAMGEARCVFDDAGGDGGGIEEAGAVAWTCGVAA